MTLMQCKRNLKLLFKGQQKGGGGPQMFVTIEAIAHGHLGGSGGMFPQKILDF